MFLLIPFSCFSLVASVQHAVLCDFSPTKSSSSNNEFKTCFIKHQAISNQEIFISTERKLSVEELVIESEKSVNFIPENVGTKFPELILFKVTNCSVNSLSDKNFKGLYKLNDLLLGNNQIEFIDEKAFLDNFELVHLSLEENKINHLRENTFDSLIKLKVLSLNNNEIKFVSSEYFRGLQNVETINLNNNKIRFVDRKAFENLKNIKEISFSHNQLQIVDNNLLKKNVNLEKVWFINNRIKSIGSQLSVGKSNLLYVDLSNNSCINEAFKNDWVEHEILYFWKGKTPGFDVMKEKLEIKCSKTFDNFEDEIADLKNELKFVTNSFLIESKHSEDQKVSSIKTCELSQVSLRRNLEAEISKVTKLSNEIQNSNSLISSNMKKFDKCSTDLIDSKVSIVELKEKVRMLKDKIEILENDF